MIHAEDIEAQMTIQVNDPKFGHYWGPVALAVGMILRGDAKQVKNEEWTVYQTESCIRIDIFLKESN